MNRALLIPEILRLIIRHLHPTSTLEGLTSHDGLELTRKFLAIAKSDSQSLVNAALVCPLFSEHALDYLWWLMADLTPLFRLLPAFKPAGPSIKVSLLEGEIHPNEIKRFNSYARRVRAYRMTGKEKLHASTMARMLRECDRSYLLPALQFLCVDGSAVAPLALVSPGLQGLMLSSSGINHPDRSFFLEASPCLSVLPRMTQDLRNLSVVSNLSRDTFAAITRLTRLDGLTINHSPGLGRPRLEVDVIDILQMSSTQTLHQLHIVQSIDFNPLPSSWTGFETTNFSALRRLAITTGATTMKILNSLLRSTFMPCLQSLSIDLPLMPNQNDHSERAHWLIFFQLLPQITSGGLQSIEFVSWEGYYVNQWTSLGLAIESIPDIGLLDIQEFQVTIPLFQSISTSSLEHIARFWRNMKVLNLGTDPTPLLGLHALSLLAQSLPRLESLIMALPSENYVHLKELPVLSHGLKELELLHLKAPHPRDFVRAIDKLFPRLIDWTLTAEDPELQDTWDEAHEMLSYLQSAREDQTERERENED